MFDLSAIWLPTCHEDIHRIPAAIKAVSLAGVQNITDSDLYLLPSSLERLYIVDSKHLVNLHGLHHLKSLKYLEINLCCNITKESINELCIALPGTKIEIWGCWQIESSKLCTSYSACPTPT
jgi:hypothetical protein